MGWLITLAVLFLVGAIPIGISIHFDANGFAARVIAGFIRFTIYPFPKWMTKKTRKKPTQNPSKQAPNTTADSATKKVPTQNPPASPAPSGGKLRDFLPFISVGVQFLKDFRKKLRINHFRMQLILAEEDPCDLAVHYGWANGIMENIAVQLERYFVIVERNFEVGCDFLADEPRILAHLDITITIGRVLLLAAVYGYQVIVLFLSMKKKQKDGASL